MNTYTVRSIVEIKLDAFNESDAVDAIKDALSEVESIGAELVSIEIELIEQN